MANAERIKEYECQNYRLYMRAAEMDKAMHTLEGILRGIVIDQQVNLAEVKEVVAWYKQYEAYVSIHPFSELIPAISRAMEDGVVEQHEIDDMQWLCANLQTGSAYYDVITADIQKLQGILQGILADNDYVIKV